MQLNKLSRGAKLSALVVVLVAIDQIVKLAVHHYLEVGDRIEVFSWFNLCYVENNGFAFGMQLGSGATKFLNRNDREKFGKDISNNPL